jgi:hypothetical protein
MRPKGGRGEKGTGDAGKKHGSCKGGVYFTAEDAERPRTAEKTFKWGKRLRYCHREQKFK